MGAIDVAPATIGALAPDDSWMIIDPWGGSASAKRVGIDKVEQETRAEQDDFEAAGDELSARVAPGISCACARGSQTDEVVVSSRQELLDSVQSIVDDCERKFELRAKRLIAAALHDSKA